MPWTVADVDAHIKGLSAKQKRAWVAIANSALAKCEAEHRDNCDALAIRQANAAAKRVHESDDPPEELDILVEVGRAISAKTRQRIDAIISELQAIIAAATEVTESATDDAEQLVGDLVPLVERAVRRDGTIPVKIIQPGWGSSGYYPKQVLERDGPKVFCRGTKMYWDHPTKTESRERPERSLKDLAAELVSDARYEESGVAGPGLYADAKVFAPYKGAIEDLAPHIGVSINAYGYHEAGTAEGREGSIVKEMVASKFNSADFVTVAGAGGQVVQLFESARNWTPQTTQEVVELDEKEAQQLREAANAATQRAEAAEKALAGFEQELSRMREAAIIRDHRDMVNNTLATVQMPAITRDRLGKVLAERPVIKDGQYDAEASKAMVEAAAKDELEYLSKLGGGGKTVIRGMGQSTGSGEMSDDDISAKLNEAFKEIGLDEKHAKQASLIRS